MKRLLIILLAMMMTFTSFYMFGCNDNDDSQDDGNNGGAITDVTFEDTQTDLVNNGATQYSIVIPTNAEYLEEFAASEFKNIFAMSTGITLNVIKDNSEMSTTGHYFSIGNTTLKQKSGVTVSITDKEFAFKVERKDNTVIMTGVDGNGTVFAAYEFLEKQLGYTYYAADEIYVDTVTNEKLIDINFEYAPFLTRQRVSNLMNSTESALRYYSVRPEWLLGWPHSHLSVIQPKVYQQLHPEWFNVKNTTGKPIAICLANEAMAKEYAKVLVQRLDETGYKGACMGQEDDWGRCGCNDCKALDQLYTQSGTNIIFVNRVAEEMERIYAEQGRPDFDFELSLLAYYQNEDAPVKKNAAGEWEPIDNKLMLNEHVGVQLCLFYSDAAAPFMSEKNSQAVKESEGWNLLSGGDKMEYWIYRGYFVMYNMMYYNDWAYIADWIKALEHYNCRQGQWDSLDPYVFSKLRAYLCTQLCYDVTQNTYELIEDFINHYYKEAAPYVQEFFDGIATHLNMMKDYYESKNQDFGFYVLGRSQHQNLYKKETWPEALLLKWQDVFSAGQKAIDDSDQSAYMKEVLTARLSNESIFPRYWALNFYKNSYAPEVYTELKEQVLDEAYKLGYDPGYVYLP